MRPRCAFALALAALASSAGPLSAGDQSDKKPTRELAFFGVLRGLTAEEARTQAETWLRQSRPLDDTTRQQLAAIWADSGRPVLDRVADTLTLGDAEARRLLAEARDPDAAPPADVPAVLKDARKPVFYRANLALTYAKALASRRYYEEMRDALRAVRVEQVADPAAYLFHRATAEYGLLLRAEATETITRLLDDVTDAPERYKAVAGLMYSDMLTWRDKGLAEVARKMSLIERRLENKQGGEKTRKVQREVVARLDELIKELEQPPDGPRGPDGAGPPEDRRGANRSSRPLDDDQIIGGAGEGKVDMARFKNLVEVWGKLPEKEQVRALRGLARQMPPRYQEVIENYFRILQKAHQAK